MKKIEIERITYLQAQEIWKKYKPIGLFYFIVRDFDYIKFIGIDNSTGDAWTEEFNSYTKCISWLKGEFEIEEVEDRKINFVDLLRDMFNRFISKWLRNKETD